MKRRPFGLFSNDKISSLLAVSFWLVLLPHGVFAQSNADWQQIKRNCGLDPGLAYNTWVAQGMPCNNGGGAQAQPVGPSPEQIRQNQLIADARALNQKGLDAFESNDYDAALGFFQQALDKTPNDTGIQQNLQNAQNKIDERNKFNQNKQDALNDLKDPSGANGGNSDTGLKDAVSDQGDSSADGQGLKDIHVDAVKQADQVHQDPDAFRTTGSGLHFIITL